MTKNNAGDVIVIRLFVVANAIIIRGTNAGNGVYYFDGIIKPLRMLNHFIWFLKKNW